MLTLPVKPIWTINLDHAATRLASTSDGKRIVIAAEGPLISVGGVGKSLRTIKLKEPVGHLSISPDGELLVVANASHALRVLRLGDSGFGNELYGQTQPVHDACEFSRDGRALWSVGLVANDVAEIRCYDTQTFKLVASHHLKLPIGQCGFILTIHPREDVIGLWACGGPDAAWNYWVKRNSSSIEVRHQPELDGTTPPAFNSRGDRFVILNEYDLVTFSFPECKVLYEPVTSIDEDDAWREIMVMLDGSEDRVLASTDNNRLFVVGLGQGSVTAEIHLEGHEPRPCYEVYKSLPKTDDGLCTDFHWLISRHNGVVVSVHTHGKTTSRRDTVLCWLKP